MNTTLLLAGACLLNAIVTCGVLQLLYKRVIKSDIRYPITFVTYLAFCFMATSGGQGIVNMSLAEVDWFKFFLYATSGLAVCTVLYIIERVNRKNTEIYGKAAMEAARKRKKK